MIYIERGRKLVIKLRNADIPLALVQLYYRIWRQRCVVSGMHFFRVYMVRWKNDTWLRLLYDRRFFWFSPQSLERNENVPISWRWGVGKFVVFESRISAEYTFAVAINRPRWHWSLYAEDCSTRNFVSHFTQLLKNLKRSWRGPFRLREFEMKQMW